MDGRAQKQVYGMLVFWGITPLSKAIAPRDSDGICFCWCFSIDVLKAQRILAELWKIWSSMLWEWRMYKAKSVREREREGERFNSNIIPSKALFHQLLSPPVQSWWHSQPYKWSTCQEKHFATAVPSSFVLRDFICSLMVFQIVHN